MNYLQHALSAAFPSMGADDLQALTDDIDNNGQREPIMLYEGQVLDGWHRYQACASLNMHVKSNTLPDGEDPVAYVKSLNHHRRNQTGSQRAASIVALSQWRLTHAKGEGKPSLPSPSSSTNAQMAKDADVSIQTIHHAKAAHAAGVGDAVRDGKVTAKRGAEIAKLPAAERAAAVDAPKPAKPTASVRQAEEDRIAHDAFGDFDPLAELAAAQKELEVLQAQLLATEADDQKAEALKWKRLHHVAERRQGELMDSTHQSQKREKWVMDQLRRCGKAVGEEDPMKIALAVERAVAARLAA